MIINDSEYDDRIINYLQQAQMALNNILISFQGSALGYSDYEKLYVSISYKIKDGKSMIRIDCKENKLRSTVWKLLGKKCSTINDKIKDMNKENIPVEIELNKLEFYTCLTQLNVKAEEI